MTKLAEQRKQGADRAWESLSEGWREPSARASGAPTRFWSTPADRPGLHGARRTPVDASSKRSYWRSG